MNIIDELRNVEPMERVGIIETLYQKNCNYFQQNNPGLLEQLQKIQSPYEIQLTTDFLTLTDVETNELCVEAELDIYAEQHGDLVHQGWIDFQDFTFPVIAEENPVHAGCLKQLKDGLSLAFPQWLQRYEAGKVFIQEGYSGKSNSPPTIFIGVFHGLHIASYLHKVELASMFMIEPDIEKFEVSLYFLDYAELHEKIPHIEIVLGDEIKAGLQRFMKLTSVPSMVWLRGLPAYSTGRLTKIAKDIIERQSGCLHGLTPIDRALSRLQNEETNVAEGELLLSKAPQISDGAQIIIAAPGDSLEENLDWLKANRNNFILFAVHSAVLKLRQAGIDPDFQFVSESPESSEILKLIQFPQEVPAILPLSTSKEIIRLFPKPLLVPELDITSFHYSLRLQCSPATENLAMEFALACGATRIFLLGVDCAEAHSSFQNDEPLAARGPRANFGEDDGKLQESYHHIRVRKGLENSLGRRENLAVEVYNLSRGAYLDGALPVRAEKIDLPVYNQQEVDKEIIIQSFSTSDSTNNWRPFDKSGKELLRQFVRDILERLYAERYSFKIFSHLVDTALENSLQEVLRQSNADDLRCHCYAGIVTDLLRCWYTCLLFCENDIEGEIVYRNGLVLLENILEEMEWPERNVTF